MGNEDAGEKPGMTAGGAHERAEGAAEAGAGFTNILLSVDLNDPTSWRRALPVAVAQAKAFGARLNVMTVVPDFGMTIVGQFFPAGYEKHALDEAERELKALTAKEVPADVPVHHVVALGRIYEEILAAAKHLDVDLIVLASHRPELRDYLIGPNAARVVRHADRSVLVVRG